MIIKNEISKNLYQNLLAGYNEENLLMRMTWEEIVKAYPKQYVALVDVYPDIYKLESAVVVHSEKDMSESDMFRGAMDGKWVVKGTSVDADFNMGTQFA